MWSDASEAEPERTPASNPIIQTTLIFTEANSTAAAHVERSAPDPANRCQLEDANTKS